MKIFKPLPIWRKWAVVILIGLLGTSIISISYTNALPLMSLIMEDLQLTYAQCGSLTSTFFLTVTIFFIPLGIASDRWGRKIFVILSLILVTLGSISLIWCSSFLSAVATRVLLGIGYAMYLGPSVAMLANWFTSRQLGLSIGIWLIGYYLGMELGEFIPPLLVRFGWQNAIWITIFPGFIIVLLIIIFVKEKPDETGSPSLNVQANINSIQNFNGNGKSDWYQILKSKDLWICGLWSFGSYAGLTGIATWLPTFLNEVHAMTLEYAGLITGLATGGVGIIMAVPAGIFCDLVMRRILLMILGNVILGGSIIYMAQCKAGFFIIMAILIGLGLTLGVVAAFAYRIEIAGLKAAGGAVNMCEAIGSVGGIISPWIIGLLFDTFRSWSLCFLIIGIGVIISGLICFFAKEPQTLSPI